MTNIGCMPLVEIIKKKINNCEMKAISFYDYMSLCLYHEQYGYYVNNQTKIGKKGDFYTSSSVGTIMGEMLANYISNQLQTNDGKNISIVEWGGGTGRLAKQVLDELQDNHIEIYELIKFISIEESAYHKQLQSNSLIEHIGKVQFVSAEEWLNEKHSENVIIFSNELLDAFPVHRLIYDDEEYNEIFVSWDDQENKFIEKYIKCTDQLLLVYIKNENLQLKQGQKFEVNLAATKWLRKLMNNLTSSTIITIDYGDLKDEIYAAHRMKGTLMCYYKHQASQQPYYHVGEQDITSHVNFSACISVGENMGFSYSYMTQKEFLFQSGILNKLQQHNITDPFHPTVKRNRTIRQLLLSDQMSELFKVLIQKKDV
ncbi:class I SAM-dependent methyltransferase [Chengkuizengella sediminis]|uniref:class I SAM-dependent methyltransferase n=1 Tax=Chengkuizengella sediminis TaxID=1885917 RepID=UPI0013894D51|nr:SAM-dependent methyltransferase [Chengkuizengella sediminis]NDI33683.1 SAM-dependent methyltransferase [Chengkuizengella sediminis]